MAPHLQTGASEPLQEASDPFNNQPSLLDHSSESEEAFRQRMEAASDVLEEEETSDLLEDYSGDEDQQHTQFCLQRAIKNKDRN